MESTIKEHLRHIEREHEVRILMAVESGSRAWGFPSPNSDYDARFVYVHPRKWYLSLDERRDVIEEKCTDLLDINGWDLRKALTFYRKTNPVIYEWLQSPIIYQQDVNFVSALIGAKDKFFSPKPGVHHYLSMAERVFADCTGEEVKLKKYFYALRAALSARWIVENESCPPMELKPLLRLVPESTQVDAILQLIDDKKLLNESEKRAIPDAARLVVTDSVQIAKSGAPTVSVRTGDMQWLNDFFVATIG
jgi:predicted nucleotidyltransferase